MDFAKTCYAGVVLSLGARWHLKKLCVCPVMSIYEGPRVIALMPQDKAWSVSDAATVLSAMGNERRLQTILHLLDGEASVNDLVDVIGLSQSALSQHLAVLRRAGVVKTRREAQTIFYSIQSIAVIDILAALHAPHIKRFSKR